MHTTTTTTTTAPTRLQNFPITFFAIILGMSGFTLALQKSIATFHIPPLIYSYSLGITLALLGGFTLLYLLKIFMYPQSFKEEINHPVKMNFFPLPAKILLVLSVVFLEVNTAWALKLWVAGSILQLASSLFLISRWLRHTYFKMEHLSPGWFIPIVGAIIVPVSGVPLGFVEISWFFFSVGIFFFITLFVIVFNRIIFHNPIPQKLLPTMFILFAPTAIGFIAWTKLQGSVDSFGRILYYSSFFLFLLVFFRLDMFAKIKFYLSWWAYSFPLAAITLSSFLAWHQTHNPFFYYTAAVQMVLLTIAIIGLSIITIKQILQKQICIPEE
jgi:tellurite resistance protein